MKSVECHLHALMCSVSVVTVVFIHTMEDDQRLDTLVHEGVISARLVVVSAFLRFNCSRGNPYFLSLALVSDI